MKRTAVPRPWMPELRTKLGISPDDLAERVDVTAYYISNIERGISRPSPELAIAIGAELGLSESESLVRFFGKIA